MVGHPQHSAAAHEPENIGRQFAKHVPRQADATVIGAPTFRPTSLESGHARSRCRSPPQVVLAKCSPRRSISVRFPRPGWPIWQRCWRGPLRQGELAAVHARDVLRSEPQTIFPQLATETEQATKDGECSSELGSCACSFKLTIM